MKKTKKSNFTK